MTDYSGPILEIDKLSISYFTPLREFLLGRQRADGSWANGTGPGPAFSTAMACLILEIPYDFLPIFHR